VPLAMSVPVSSQLPGAVLQNINSGATALDPVSSSYFTANIAGPAGVTAPYPYSNGLKAAWVQFLNLRHGGSGFMFGFGTGAVGQNVAINGGNGFAGSRPGPPPTPAPGIPAEIPFRSLSYPDIDHTIMRPAALPPTGFTTP